MVSIDQCAPVRFLQAAFDPNDSIGVLLKTYRTGQVIQRIVPVASAISDRFQAWLRHMNAHSWNVYVGVNAYRPGRSRAREAVAQVRHLFLEEDLDGPGLLATLSTRPDLPPPSYVLHSSPGRLHVLWRVRDIAPSRVEQLQKELARELLTDRAATSCTQATRLPGLFNHKRQPSVRVGIEYLHWRDVFVARDLPAVSAGTTPSSMTKARRPCPATRLVERARAFLQCVDPAVAGQQGDLRTFRVCCRIVRGFDLSDDEAVRALSEWNARCEPPWSERELRQKVMNARRYGREPQGGLL
ncbi:MAG: DNA-primase RepB domain-containing protein [Vicinamibacterales bacterium]